MSVSDVLTPHMAIGVIGSDLPRQIVFAAGATPVQIHGSWTGPPSAEARTLLGAVDVVAQRILTELLGEQYRRLGGLVICNDTAAHLRLFYVARMLWNTGRLPYPVHLLDAPRRPGRARVQFVANQYAQLFELLTSITGYTPRIDDLNTSAKAEMELGKALEQVREKRRVARCSGAAALEVYLAVGQFSHAEAMAKIAEVPITDAAAKVPVFITGSNHPDITVYRQVEDAGITVVGEDHATGDPVWIGDAVVGKDMNEIFWALATRHTTRPPLASRSPSSARATQLVTDVQRTVAMQVLCLVRELDDAPLWDLPAQRQALKRIDIPMHTVSRVTSSSLLKSTKTLANLATTPKEHSDAAR